MEFLRLHIHQVLPVQGHTDRGGVFASGRGMLQRIGLFGFPATGELGPLVYHRGLLWSVAGRESRPLRLRCGQAVEDPLCQQASSAWGGRAEEDGMVLRDAAQDREVQPAHGWVRVAEEHLEGGVHDHGSQVRQLVRWPAVLPGRSLFPCERCLAYNSLIFVVGIPEIPKVVMPQVLEYLVLQGVLWDPQCGPPQRSGSSQKLALSEEAQQKGVRGTVHGCPETTVPQISGAAHRETGPVPIRQVQCCSPRSGIPLLSGMPAVLHWGWDASPITMRPHPGHSRQPETTNHCCRMAAPRCSARRRLHGARW